ncbi:MAG: hypothetical protein KKA97_01115 [Actinobacteria bacterium]|nr:hypothetical protein [Actinomycetota bacterium]
MDTSDSRGSTTQRYGLVLRGTARTTKNAKATADLRANEFNGLFNEHTAASFDLDTMLGKTGGPGEPLVGDDFYGASDTIDGRTAPSAPPRHLGLRLRLADRARHLREPNLVPGVEALSGSGKTLAFVGGQHPRPASGQEPQHRPVAATRRTRLPHHQPHRYSCVHIRPSAGELRLGLQKVAAGVATIPVVFTRQPQVGDVLDVTAIGNDITLWVDGAEVGSVTDSAGAASTKPGTLGEATDLASTFTGFRVWAAS